MTKRGNERISAGLFRPLSLNDAIRHVARDLECESIVQHDAEIAVNALVLDVLSAMLSRILAKDGSNAASVANVPQLLHHDNTISRTLDSYYS